MFLKLLLTQVNARGETRLCRSMTTYWASGNHSVVITTMPKRYHDSKNKTVTAGVLKDDIAIRFISSR